MARLSCCEGSWPDMDDIKKVKWLVSGQTKKKKNSKKRQMTRKWACGGVSYEQVGSFAYTRQERILEKERRNGKESSSHSIISVVSWTAKSSSPVISSRFLRLSFLYFLFGSAEDASTIVLFLLGAAEDYYILSYHNKLGQVDFFGNEYWGYKYCQSIVVVLL